MALSQQDEKDLYDPNYSFKRLIQKLQAQDVINSRKDIKSHPQGIAYLMERFLMEYGLKKEEEKAAARQKHLVDNPPPPLATPPAEKPVAPAVPAATPAAPAKTSWFNDIIGGGGGDTTAVASRTDERLPVDPAPSGDGDNPLSRLFATLRGGDGPAAPAAAAAAPARAYAPSGGEQPRAVQRRPELPTGAAAGEQPPSDAGGFEGPLTADQERATQIAAAEAPEGERGAVMNVMLERMKRSGRGLGEIVDQEGQFEAGSNGSYRGFQPGTAPYNRAEAETRRSIASGGTEGPGAGMTNFWSPPAQEKLGRAPPRWAGNLERQGVPQETIGNQRYYNDPNWRYPGGNRPGAAGDRPVAVPPSREFRPRDDEVWPPPPQREMTGAPPVPPDMRAPTPMMRDFDPTPMRDRAPGAPGGLQQGGFNPALRNPPSYPALPPGATMAPTSPFPPPPRAPQPPPGPFPPRAPMQPPDPAMQQGGIPGPQSMGPGPGGGLGQQSMLPPPRMGPGGMPGQQGMLPPPMQMAGGPGGPESPFVMPFAPTNRGGSTTTSPQTGLPPELQPRPDVLPLSGPEMHARVDEGLQPRQPLLPQPGTEGLVGGPGGPAGAMPPPGVPMPPPRPQGPPAPPMGPPGALAGPGGAPIPAEFSAQARQRPPAPVLAPQPGTEGLVGGPRPPPAPVKPPPAPEKPARVPTITPNGDVAQLPPLGLRTPPKAVLDYARRDWNSGHPEFMQRAKETMEPYTKPLEWLWKDIDGRLHAVHPETAETYPVGPTGITEPAPGEVVEPLPGGVHERKAQEARGTEAGKALGQRTAPMTPDEVLKYRADIRGMKSYLKYSGAKSVYGSMYDTAHQNDKASDLNLVFGMATLLDPESVVRGTEEQGVRNTASLPEWLKGYANMLAAEGSALTPQTREHLLREAHTRMNNYYKEYNQDLDVYRRVETRRKGEPGEIVGNDIEPPLKWVPPGETDRRAAAEELHRRAFEKEKELREKIRRGEHR